MESKLLPIHYSSIPFHGTHVGYPKEDSQVDLTLTIRHAKLTPEDQEHMLNCINELPNKRKYFNHKEVDKLLGISSSDLKTLKEFFDEHRIKIRKKNNLQRSLVIEGTWGNLLKTKQYDFGLQQYKAAIAIVWAQHESIEVL